MCSIVTNLVTSLELQPIRCATVLFHFGRTRNGYVATDSFSSLALRRAVLNAATWSLRNAPAKVRRELVERWNGLGKNLVLLPTVDLIHAVCNQM